MDKKPSLEEFIFGLCRYIFWNLVMGAVFAACALAMGSTPIEQQQKQAENAQHKSCK